MRALPHDVVFFDPNGIPLGYFGIPKAMTDQAYPLSTDERFVSAGRADTGTVTAVCRKEPNSKGQVLCFVRSKVADGIDTSWEIYARPDEALDRLLQADTFTRTVCSSIFDLPGCKGVDRSTP